MRISALLMVAGLSTTVAGAVESAPVTAALAADFSADLPDPPPLHAPVTDTGPDFDPLQGMDVNGRIPKVVLPDDIPHPERWRYVPEGRIKPGNVIDRFLVSSFIAPLVYYEEAVGAGGGISLTDIDFREQRRQEFAGFYGSRTTLGQEQYGVIWQRWLDHRNIPAGGVVTEERSWVRAVLSYQHTLTDRFYGLGAETKWHDETSYSDRSEVAGLLLQSSVPHAGDDWVVVAGARIEHHRLGAGHVPDWPSTDQVFPGLYANGVDQQSAWLTAALRYDTRDSQSNPYSGWLVEAGVDAEPWSRDEANPGSQHGEIWHLTSSYAIAVPGLFHSGGDAHEENPPTDVLAIGGFVTWVDGDLPFWDLPSLGGVNTLRGYIGGRFTDRAAWHVAAEYRVWVIPRGLRLTDSIRIERFGVAPFVEIGSVADSLTHLETSAKHESYGLSFRAELERTAVFRFDVGLSAEGMAFNLAYGLSF